MLIKCLLYTQNSSILRRQPFKQLILIKRLIQNKLIFKKKLRKQFSLYPPNSEVKIDREGKNERKYTVPHFILHRNLDFP